MELSTNLPKPVLLCKYTINNKKRERLMPIRILMFNNGMEIEKLVLEASLDLIRRHDILYDVCIRDIMDKVRLVCKIYLEEDYNKLNEQELELLKRDMDKGFKPDMSIYDKRIEFKNNEENEWDSEKEISKIKEDSVSFVNSVKMDKEDSASELLEEDSNSFIQELAHNYLSINRMKSSNELVNAVEEVHFISNPDLDSNTSNSHNSSQLVGMLNKQHNKMTSNTSNSASSIVDEVGSIQSDSLKSMQTFELKTQSSSRLFAPLKTIEVTEVNDDSKTLETGTVNLVQSIDRFAKRLSISK